MTLLDNCVEALGKNTTVLIGNESHSLLKDFMDVFPLTKWGRIDWLKIEKKIEVYAISELVPLLSNWINSSVFILWDEISLPIIESELHKVLEKLQDIPIVSFDTWIFSFDKKYVIEFYHEGNITIGFID